jgi:hypothetical protein
MIDPDPEAHIWKCIAVTRHKVRDLNKDDTHVKVKAIVCKQNSFLLRCFFKKDAL